MQKALNQVSDLLELPLVEELKRETRDELDYRLPLSLFTASLDEVTLAEPSDEAHASYVELAVYPPMTNTLGSLPRKPQPGEIVLPQLKEHWPEVKKAMLKEFQTWAKLRCSSRKARSSARNIIDVRWVVKFKWEVPTSDVCGSRQAEACAPASTIRARSQS